MIEDEPDVREPCAIALERAGYEVMPARSWQEAIRFAEGGAVNVGLIVTDLAMPDDCGVAAFKTLRSLCGDPHVIVVSAHPKLMSLLDGVLDGVIDWRQKPLTVSALVEAVDHAVCKSRG